MIALVATGLIWLTGAATALVACLGRRSNSGISVAAAGAGGWASILSLAALLAASNQLAIPSFLLPTIVLLASQALIGLLLWRSQMADVGGRSVVARGAVKLLFVSAGFLFVYGTLYLSRPADGWDVLDFWAPVAASYIDHVLGSDLPFDMVNCRSPGFDCTVFSKEFYRHPSTLLYLMGYFGWDANESNITSWGILWGLMALSASMVIWGWSYFVTGNRMFSFITVGLFFFGMPLVENHIFIPGYTGLPLATTYLCASVFIAVGLQDVGIDFKMVSVGLLFSLCLIFMRNTGVVFFGGLSMCLLLSMNQRFKMALIGILLTTLAAALFFYFRGISTELLGLKFAFDRHDKVLYFAGKVLVFAGVSHEEVLSNILHANLRNLSFSVFYFAILVIIPSIAFRSHRALFLSATFFIMHAGLYAAQFSRYGFDIGRVGYDTGISRMMLPVFMQSISLMPLAFLFVESNSSGSKQRITRG